MGENHMINLKTKIKKHTVNYTWNKRLRGIKGNSLYFVFESDISGVPDHVFNFMFGLFLMDALVFTGKEISFSELTNEEEIHLNNILKMNHDSKGCAGRSQNRKMPVIHISARANDNPPQDTNEIICANGLGKDGLNVALLTLEMGYTPFCYTVLNQYWRNRKLWVERLKTISSFYKEENIDHTFINSNFFKIKKNPIGFYPYALGLPLAYLKDTNVVLDGIQIHNNKTRLSDGSFYCPGETHVVFDQVTRATEITLSSPLRAISNFGSQKLLADKWPQYLKYQRSCMFGFPWCGKCSKCNRKALYLKLLGVDHKALGLPDFNYEKLKLGNYMAVGGSIKQCLAKLKGAPYEKWIEGANGNALVEIWNGDKLKKILSEYFEIYGEDPGPDGEGYTLEPSKWKAMKKKIPTL